mmetsp:Transcript_46276/g.106834  ORF Transcript_46276/g.106834 Transcript_46276/m.106834 type:complete len:225 (+) Transcript_46276:1730-2404(+)
MRPLRGVHLPAGLCGGHPHVARQAASRPGLHGVLRGLGRGAARAGGAGLLRPLARSLVRADPADTGRSHFPAPLPEPAQVHRLEAALAAPAPFVEQRAQVPLLALRLAARLLPQGIWAHQHEAGGLSHPAGVADAVRVLLALRLLLGRNRRLGPGCVCEAPALRLHARSARRLLRPHRRARRGGGARARARAACARARARPPRTRAARRPAIPAQRCRWRGTRL